MASDPPSPLTGPTLNRAWATHTAPTLEMTLASTARTQLVQWLRECGDRNGIVALRSGPLDTRLNLVRQIVCDDVLIVWCDLARWASGERLQARLPGLRLEFRCVLHDGVLAAESFGPIAPHASADPREDPSSVGVELHVSSIKLLGARAAPPNRLGLLLHKHFEAHAVGTWAQLAEALGPTVEAEAQAIEQRAGALTARYVGAFLNGSSLDMWTLSGVPETVRNLLGYGEWIELLDDRGQVACSGRVLPSEHRPADSSTLVVRVPNGAEPPRSGVLRPRIGHKAVEQQRGLLAELRDPSGKLPYLVRLVAAPSHAPIPRAGPITSFVDSRVGANRSQAEAVSKALGLPEGGALLIQGPPGTGKSTTAAEIVAQLVRGDTFARVLVCSHSNHGTDNILLKTAATLPDASRQLARIGVPDRVAQSAQPYYAEPWTDLQDRSVVFTTVDSMVLQDTVGARLYDYVILDEANRAGILDSLLALARGTRMILVGDPMQLQPVASEAQREPAVPGSAALSSNNSLFVWLQGHGFPAEASAFLAEQNRMHVRIGELVSRVFYGGRVVAGPSAPRAGTGMHRFPSPVTWVDTRTLAHSAERRVEGGSVFNAAEAQLVASLTRVVSEEAPSGLSIGVISAYAEQTRLLQRLLQGSGIPIERHLEVDTVDAFEGREKDVIILSLVRTNRIGDIGFLRFQQRLNVAISRARRSLIIVGHTPTLREGPFPELLAAVAELGSVVPA